MPNTPSKIGKGVQLLYFSPSVNSSEQGFVEELFSSSGELFVFQNEDQIDLVTPHCGSGPAFVFELARILIADLEEKGISRVGAEKMIKYMFYGASSLLLNSTGDMPIVLSQYFLRGEQQLGSKVVLDSLFLESGASKRIKLELSAPETPGNYQMRLGISYGWIPATINSSRIKLKVKE